MVPTRYRKKPVVIEAMRLSTDTTEPDGEPSVHDLSLAVISGWMPGHGFRDFKITGDRRPYGVAIATLEGEMIASPGDWIIRGIKGEFYPCRDDIFEATYERAEPA